MLTGRRTSSAAGEPGPGRLLNQNDRPLAAQILEDRLQLGGVLTDITLGVEPFAIADAGHLGHEALVGGDTHADRIDLDTLGARVSRGSLGVLSGHGLIDRTGGSSGVGDAVREQDHHFGGFVAGSIVGIEQDGSAVTSLPSGKQRRLEIARALATKPELLLLDEPAAGMNPQETDELGRFIVEIKGRFGLTIFLIEHHMDLVMDISDRIYVIDFGKLIAHGAPHEVQDNPDVITAYLGVEDI